MDHPLDLQPGLQALVAAERDLHPRLTGGPHAGRALVQVAVRQVDQHRRHLRHRFGVSGINRVAQPGHPVVPRQGGHQYLPGGGHCLQQIRPLVQVHAVFDGVGAVADRRRAAVQPLGMGGDPEAQAVRLIGHGRQLRLGQLERIGILHLVGPGPGRHHLDEVGTGADLLPDRAPHVVRAVCLPVHVAVETPARRRRRDDLPAGQQARAAERAVAHRLPRLLRRQALRARDADGRHPVAQIVAQLGLQEVRAGPREHRLRAAQDLRDPARRVGVRVDQPRHQRPLPHVQPPGTIRARLRRIPDVPDDPVLHQDRRALADRRAGAVKQPRAGQPQPSLSGGRRRYQRREPMCHAGTAPPRIVT